MHRIPRAALLAALGLSVLGQSARAQENQFLDQLNDHGGADKDASPPPTRAERSAAPVSRSPSVPPAAREGGSPAANPPEKSIPAGQGAPPEPVDRESARIRLNDTLKVKVAKADDLSSTGRVNAKGQILMPLIGPVEVAGLTPQEAEERIAEILGRDYLQAPRVEIKVIMPTSGTAASPAGAKTPARRSDSTPTR